MAPRRLPFSHKNNLAGSDPQRGFQELLGAHLTDCVLAVAEEPYALEPPQLQRAQEFFSSLHKFPRGAHVAVRSNGAGDVPRQARQLASRLWFDGPSPQFQRLGGLHWRPTYLITQAHVWGAHFDRNLLGCAQRNLACEFARARAGILGVSGYSIGADEFTTRACAEVQL